MLSKNFNPQPPIRSEDLLAGDDAEPPSTTEILTTLLVKGRKGYIPIVLLFHLSALRPVNAEEQIPADASSIKVAHTEHYSPENRKRRQLLEAKGIIEAGSDKDDRLTPFGLALLAELTTRIAIEKAQNAERGVRRSPALERRPIIRPAEKDLAPL